MLWRGTLWRTKYENATHGWLWRGSTPLRLPPLPPFCFPKQDPITDRRPRYFLLSPFAKSNSCSPLSGAFCVTFTLARFPPDLGQLYAQVKSEVRGFSTSWRGQFADWKRDRRGAGLRQLYHLTAVASFALRAYWSHFVLDPELIVSVLLPVHDVVHMYIGAMCKWLMKVMPCSSSAGRWILPCWPVCRACSCWVAQHESHGW